jgi:hypothetical protein
VSSLIIVCVDPRMPRVLEWVVSQVNPGSYTAAALGCSLHVDLEFPKIDLMIEKLHVDRIALIDHLACKAFELRFGQLSRQQETQRHLAVLNQAAEELRQRYCDTQVSLYLLPKVTTSKIGTELLRVSGGNVLVPL